MWYAHRYCTSPPLHQNSLSDLCLAGKAGFGRLGIITKELDSSGDATNVTKPTIVSGAIEGKNIVTVASTMRSSFFLTDKVRTPQCVTPPALYLMSAAMMIDEQGELYFTGSMAKSENSSSVLQPRCTSQPRRLREGDLQNKHVQSIACGFNFALIVSTEGDLLALGQAKGITPDDKPFDEPTLVNSHFGCLPVSKVACCGARAYITL